MSPSQGAESQGAESQGAEFLCVGPLSQWYLGGDRDLDTSLEGVRRWLAEVNTSLAQRLSEPIDWSEDGEVDRFPLGATAYDGLRLLAVYAERPELELPDDLPETLASEPAYAKAMASEFQQSRYAHLIVGQLWLPGDFNFTFAAPGPDGAELVIGSLAALKDQVGWLDERTLRAGAVQREEDALSRDFIASARYGLAGFRQAVEQASSRKVPLWIHLGLVDSTE